MDRLATSLAGEKASATFACGGKMTTTIESGSNTTVLSDIILFYQGKNEQSERIVFPASQAEMETLARHCDPASFGIGGEDVMDLNYR